MQIWQWSVIFVSCLPSISNISAMHLDLQRSNKAIAWTFSLMGAFMVRKKKKSLAFYFWRIKGHDNWLGQRSHQVVVTSLCDLIYSDSVINGAYIDWHCQNTESWKLVVRYMSQNHTWFLMKEFAQYLSKERWYIYQVHD